MTLLTALLLSADAFVVEEKDGGTYKNDGGGDKGLFFEIVLRRSFVFVATAATVATTTGACARAS